MTGGAETISDPVSLKNKFEEEIGSLQMLCDQFQSKISMLEHELNKDKREYVNQLQRLYERNAEAIDKIKVHQPRQRAHDALQLIQHFDEFLSDQPLNSMIFTDPDKELSKDKFLAVQARIAHRYEEVERLLIDEFGRAQRDEKKMAEVAKILSEFKRFYESKKHVKKQIHSGGLQELKRDVQARLLTVETYGGETFLSEDVAISILQETKNAFNRASQLCEKSEVPKHSENILDILLRYLYSEHLDYAVELAISGISLAEPKVAPPAYFFAVVSQNTTIVLLLMKQYEDSVLPLIKGTVVEQCVAKKWSSSLRSLEQKINMGLERQLNAIIGYVRFVLTSEQKKADFRPDNQQINLQASAVRI
ncbi:exocyst complex component Sec10 [Teladorsagia circumcincta]|uniref:Exocyst complex component 5 n=1 Tax=Teladorsagia circumcincta TaxID=45464 RepID=A0A2G9UJP3_TELCI|nr:exocyst complex component Sec10 [Teladorsagia circumcincta]